VAQRGGPSLQCSMSGVEGRRNRETLPQDEVRSFCSRRARQCLKPGTSAGRTGVYRRRRLGSSPPSPAKQMLRQVFVAVQRRSYEKCSNTC
jgi:hypothetical protein